MYHSHVHVIVETKKAGLLANIELLNRECYKRQLNLMCAHDKLLPVLDKTVRPIRKLLCADEKSYFGQSYLFIMRVLLMLREDKQVFHYFARGLDGSKEYPSSFLDNLAEELVFLFFADFSSPEKTAITFLSQLEGLICRLFKGYVKGEYPLLFEESDLMVNRLIKAFMNKYEHHDYLRILFGKIFDDADDLRSYLRKLKAKKLKGVMTEVSSDNQSTTTADEPEEALYSPITKFIPDHFDHNFKLDIVKAGGAPVQRSKTVDYSDLKEETSIAGAKTCPGQPGKFSTDDILTICDAILDRVVKKLLFMPPSMRYFCKLLEKVALQHVIIIIIC